MGRKYDLAVKVGQYEKDGVTKNKYLNVGAVLENEDGGQFILLNKTFSPAGVPDDRGGDSILISMFTPRTNEPQGGSGGDTPPF
jgi:hypothetical protein